MDNFDNGNLHLYNAQDYFLGNGKDLLIGWLVGRAGADLGLAQALAASCGGGETGNRKAEREIAPPQHASDERALPLGSIKEVDESLEGKNRNWFQPRYGINGKKIC